MEHILSLSYGKDSIACLGAIEKLKLPLDRIIHAEVWATEEIPAELPPMVKFKKQADEIIKERYGITVEHYRANYTYDEAFHLERGRTGRKTKLTGKIYGFPMQRGQWCLQQLKLPAIKKAIGTTKSSIQYIGIATDEPKRFNTLSETKISPLIKIGWTESDAKKWAEENKLLSPIYSGATRGGCWFCHNQGICQLRKLRSEYPEYWKLMKQWDKESPVTFRPDGHTIHDYEARFELEDKGYITKDDYWSWKYLKDPPERQISIFEEMEVQNHA